MADITFEQVHRDEIERLKQRRRHAGLAEGDPQHDAIGLALSGGGIRSATFNLGVLQALEEHSLLPRIDYLSTVSGGGYIGASLTWFMSRLGRDFPFRRAPDNFELTWLRQHGEYLAPGRALNRWSLAAAALRGIFVSVLTFFPLFFGLMWIIESFLGLDFVLYAGILALAVLALIYAAYAAFSATPALAHLPPRRHIDIACGVILRIAVMLVVLGSLPYVHDYLASGALERWRGWIVSSFSLSGLAALLAALRGRTEKNEAKGWRGLALHAGLLALSYGLFVWIYGLVRATEALPAWMVLPALLAAVLLLFFVNINKISMHGFYRDRLLEAFMRRDPEGEDPNDCALATLSQTAAPYHIINTTLVTIDSPHPTLRGRGGENFIFSPLYCGSPSTAHVKTAGYLGGTMDLATAFSISGAAVDPNTGSTRSRALSFFMTLVNAKIGYWIAHPLHAGNVTEMTWNCGYAYAVLEMLGVWVNENSYRVRLSDGGKFENLGLYELVRRRCKRVIVCDATADPKCTFEDLGNAIEKARADFGAQIELDVAPLLPLADGRSALAGATGRIRYADGTEGTLIYLTTMVTNGLSEDIYAYHRQHPEFPDQPTLDQFFDEAQFEAYRALGHQIGGDVFARAQAQGCLG